MIKEQILQQQCIALLTGNEKSTVKVVNLIELQGINDADLPKSKFIHQ